MQPASSALLEAQWPDLVAAVSAAIDLEATARTCGALVRRREIRSAEGSVAKFAAGRESPQRTTGQAAIWNSSATRLAWARMSRPPTFLTCPFLTIAIAS